MLRLSILVLSLLHLSRAQLYVPSSCKAQCKGVYFNVANLTDDFLSIDPQSGDASQLPPFRVNRVSTWGVALLKMVRVAVNQTGQPVTITPPAVARLLGGYSMAVYQAFAVWSENLYAYGRYFEPFSSDLVTLRNSSAAADWDALNEPYRDPNTGESVFPGNFAPSEGEAGAAQWAAISGAASRFISLFFCNNRTQQLLWCTAMDRILNETMESDGNEDRRNFPLAFRQGEDIASLVFDQMSMINLLRDNNATLADPQMGRPDIATMRSSQPTPAVHQCSSLIQGWWYWQRLSVPRVNAFRPSLNASLTPFPPASYSTMPAANISVPFFRGFAATLGGTALRATDAARGMLFAGLNGPPGRNDEAGFRRAMREVLQQSATLDDKKKTIAEFWADGPESTTPPGHWYKIAIQESNFNAGFALKNLDACDRTVWATLLVGLSLHEAGLLAWELKLRHMGARPITGIQCLVGRNAGSNTTRLGTAWRGPYQGIGRRELGSWQPYQPPTFITPPFSGYVSGHATFSAAAAEALRFTRSGFNTSFINPGYNCYLVPAGENPTERRIMPGQTGHIPNVTDRPNRGPKSTGFSPARDVVLCWEDYDQAAKQAALSRLYGGIHISIDNDDGLILGKRLGETVAAAVARLSPDNYLVKEKVTNRPPPLGSFDTIDSPLLEFICPPGTFLRSWDGRADAGGLFALGLTCSDGTFIGSLGVWGPWGQEFATSTVNDGYRALEAVLDFGGAVVGLTFIDRQDERSPRYGKAADAASGPAVTTTCEADERIVGLAARVVGGRGNIGAIGLLCGGIAVEDVTERTDEVPATPETGFFRYDYQCPEGTFVTRFFGRAGTYLNTLTAQCSRSWNLKTVGIPSYAHRTDTAYTHTQLDGYIGINVKSYSGSVDCITFVNASGAESPMYGRPAVPGPWTPLRCSDESRIIGVFGWQDAYVSSIGIICSPGEYKPVSMSTRLLRRLRNPEHALRIPGGDIISNKTSDIIPASAVPVQHSRIPTTVSGRARQVKVSRVTAVPIDDTPTRQQNVTELQAAPRSRYVQEESGNKLNTNHTAANATSMAVATDPVD